LIVQRRPVPGLDDNLERWRQELAAPVDDNDRVVTLLRAQAVLTDQEFERLLEESG
jgi:hypothetical protein